MHQELFLKKIVGPESFERFTVVNLHVVIDRETRFIEHTALKLWFLCEQSLLIMNN